MFAGLLRALAEPRPMTMAELAAELDTDADGLRLALEHCQRMGYLERTDAVCDTSGCASCPIASGCHPGPAVACRPDAPTGPAWWRITERGARAIRGPVGAATGSARPLPVRSRNAGRRPARAQIEWSRHSDLNRGPAVYETAALPLSYVGPDGEYRRCPESSGGPESGAIGHCRSRPRRRIEAAN